jgi:2-polyprenyl-6-methoxyphenol hydroxylase-like FAD-dependent oxidoreductase
MAPQVLVIGAGPVGLTMAGELARFGVPVRIVDKSAARTDKSKALALWSRSLALIDRMVREGGQTPPAKTAPATPRRQVSPRQQLRPRRPARSGRRARVPPTLCGRVGRPAALPCEAPVGSFIRAGRMP